ncbi:hypothetical protein NDU88_005247 [Pleurodeles waltl]|uniref:Uncharacterized protein n=1 Tax=Pleurodeles waltl TaxID=8319 RepID=A0AAV7RII1_PLEWA|nr:hypothetical protein NDU88_005247 [Pleurodeles waltl]
MWAEEVIENIGAYRMKERHNHEDELLYLSKEAVRVAQKAYAKMGRVPDEYGFDLRQKKNLQKNVQIIMDEKELRLLKLK